MEERTYPFTVHAPNGEVSDLDRTFVTEWVRQQGWDLDRVDSTVDSLLHTGTARAMGSTGTRNGQTLQSQDITLWVKIKFRHTNEWLAAEARHLAAEARYTDQKKSDLFYEMAFALQGDADA